MIKIYADGSCSGNPGPGGVGVVVCWPSGQLNEFSLNGGDIPDLKHTTNNRAELYAAIAAAKLVKDREVEIYSDSAYVVNGLNKYLDEWKANGWRKRDKKPVLNQDLWRRLEYEMAKRSGFAHLIYCPGHAGIMANERANDLAQYAARRSP